MDRIILISSKMQVDADDKITHALNAFVINGKDPSNLLIKIQNVISELIARGVHDLHENPAEYLPGSEITLTITFSEPLFENVDSCHMVDLREKNNHCENCGKCGGKE